MTFIDDYTRLTWVVFLREKSAADSAIRGFVAMVERQFEGHGQGRIKHFFTDNGTEYVNQSVSQFFLEKGIKHDTTPAYCHEYNGIAERFNRTLMTMMRMVLLQVKRTNSGYSDDSINQLDKRLWSETCHTAVYIKNRLPHSALPTNITPFEALFGRKPEIGHMRPFGALCYMHIPVEK